MAGDTYRLDNGIEDKYLKAIGRIVVCWGLLESQIDGMTYKILGISEGAHASMTIGIGVQFRLDMLMGLAETSIAENHHRDELIDIIKAIRRVDTDRNFIMHALWMGRGATITGYIGRRNVPGYRLEHWGVKKFEEIAETLTLLSSRLLTLALDETVRRKRGPWREKPAQQPPENLLAPPHVRNSVKRLPPPESSGE